MIRFSTSAGVEEYDLLSVAGIEFGGDIVQSGPAVDTRPVLDRRETARDVAAEAVDVATPSEPLVLLQSREDLAKRPEAATAANTAWTIPTGTSLLVRIIDSIDSETDVVGQSFRARLEEPLMVESIEVGAAGFGHSRPHRRSSERGPRQGIGRTAARIEPNSRQQDSLCVDHR